VSIVLLAQHRRDQAETVLLQALRGGGVAGLAAMPDHSTRGGVTWVRPWLHQPREAIESYVRRFRLRHVDDDSNSDSRFDRNRLRMNVWPALQAAFPHAEAALAKCAQWAQEAADGLAELATLDLNQVSTDKGLDIKTWRLLSAARRANSLRAWLSAQQRDGGASAALTTRLMAELPGAGSATWPCGGGTLRLYRGVLTYQDDRPGLDRGAATAVECQLRVRGSGAYSLPGWGGRLLVRRCRNGGVPLAWLAYMELRPRTGGERFQAGIGRPPRSLKKQYQAASIPEWQRTGPLFYSGGQLVFVPGLGLDARVLALPNQLQVSLDWQSDRLNSLAR
jgi:tRNA(Ile)-lysidine synthase